MKLFLFQFSYLNDKFRLAFCLVHFKTISIRKLFTFFIFLTHINATDWRTPFINIFNNHLIYHSIVGKMHFIVKIIEWICCFNQLHKVNTQAAVKWIYRFRPFSLLLLLFTFCSFSNVAIFEIIILMLATTFVLNELCENNQLTSQSSIEHKK